ncbi:MAG: hypothetical protein EU544_05730 [Promethearchaeota archaeon]|nr:MAG: hypothetical protein EU544_05730 [Candidatus Lokiarchaeota archaeon]
MDLTEVKDDLEGTWWHYIRSDDFGFQGKVKNLKDFEAEPGDILIHKQIKKGDKFPTIRYHLVQDKGTEVIENPQVKELLAKKLVEYVKKHKHLPYACEVAKFFKNKNAQVNYSPTEYDNFALKVIPKVHEIANTEEFFSDLESDSNPLGEDAEETPEGGEEEVWYIESSSDKSKKYKVTKNSNGSYSCTCPHHVFRKAECKHIKEVKRSQS